MGSTASNPAVDATATSPTVDTTNPTTTENNVSNAPPPPPPPPTTTTANATSTTTTTSAILPNSTTNVTSNTMPTTVATTTTTTTPTVAITTATISTTNATTPTSTVTTSTPSNQNNPSTLVSISGDAKSRWYSAAESLKSNVDREKSTVSAAYSNWYKWTKYEQKKREKDKILWYLSEPTKTSIDTISSTSTIKPIMATGKIDDEKKETTDTSSIAVAPTYQLRSTAVYSPPHGDRFLSGRSELINTDTSNFKYYNPDNRQKQMSGQHTKATMYKMNTQQRHVPLPTQSASSTVKTSDDPKNISLDDESLPNFVSRGLQTDLLTQPINSNSTPMLYYERQQPLTVPISAFPNYNPNNVGFYHLTRQNTMNQTTLSPNIQQVTPAQPNIQPNLSLQQSRPNYVRPSMQQSTPVQYIYQQNPYFQQVRPYSATIQQPPPVQYDTQRYPNVQQTPPYYTAPFIQQSRPVQNNIQPNPSFQQLRPYSATIQQPPPVQYIDQQYPSTQQVRPYYPLPPPRASILKKPSTVLSQDTYNPLSARTHDQMVEELRKRNSNANDGTYRVKKVHLLEKGERENYIPRVSFNLPSSKASQSISRSEKLLFSDIFNEKK